jgi:hypothetical protein
LTGGEALPSPPSAPAPLICRSAPAGDHNYISTDEMKNPAEGASGDKTNSL